MRLLFLTLIITLFYSCSKQGSNSESKYSSIFDINKTINLNADSITATEFILPLETTKESILGEISKIYFSDSTIFVFDSQNQKLLCFDKNSGKFLKQIWRQGRGPKEFTYISSLFYSAKEKLLYVYDGGKKKVFIFNDSGEYFNEIETDPDYFLSDFCKIENSFWIHSPYNLENKEVQYRLYEMSDDFKEVKSKHIVTNNFFDRKENSYYFQVLDNDVYFASGNDPQIYKISDNKVTPFYIIDNMFQRNSFQEISQINNRNEYEQQLYNGAEKYRISSSNFVYTGNRIYYTIGLITKKATPTYGHIFDFNNESSIFYNSFSHPHIFLGFKPIAYLDNYLIFNMNPSSMSEEHLQHINTIYNSNISIESNPCLIFTKEITE